VHGAVAPTTHTRVSRTASMAYASLHSWERPFLAFALMQAGGHFLHSLSLHKALCRLPNMARLHSISLDRPYAGCQSHPREPAPLHRLAAAKLVTTLPCVGRPACPRLHLHLLRWPTPYAPWSPTPRLVNSSASLLSFFDGNSFLSTLHYHAPAGAARVSSPRSCPKGREGDDSGRGVPLVRTR
jgi:hypothetical protein